MSFTGKKIGTRLAKMWNHRNHHSTFRCFECHPAVSCGSEEELSNHIRKRHPSRKKKEEQADAA